MRQQLAPLARGGALLAAGLAGSPSAQGPQPGQVEDALKLSETMGGFAGDLEPFDGFGFSATVVGDLDGNGADDLAVGAPFDDDGGLNRGAVWILFLDADGSVQAQQKISSVEGDFTGALEDGARLGSALAGLGDLDGDRVPDLAVGSLALDDGGIDRGGVWILFLRPDGRVRDHAFLANPEVGLAGEADGDLFGASLAFLGDFNGNTLVDLAVGATGDRAPVGLLPEGAVWIFELFPDGSAALEHKIDSEVGRFGGLIAPGHAFGSAVAGLGDLDGDGIEDLAVGAAGTGPAGRVWVLFLAADGTVEHEVRIDASTPPLAGELDAGDGLGISLARVGDLDGDAVPELASGAFAADDGGDGKGAVWILRMTPDGVPHDASKISETAGGLGSLLGPQDGFGFALSALGDRDGDGVPDLGVSAAFDDDGGLNQGAVYLLDLDGVPAAKAEPYGCGINPPGSLAAPGGGPVLGGDLELVLDNPLGTQNAGAFGLVLVSLAPDPAHPCGSPIPGVGMAGGAGELLVGLGASELLTVVVGRATWGGPGVPAVATLSVPADPAFAGALYYVQGLLYDPGGAQELGLTEALLLRIGAY